MKLRLFILWLLGNTLLYYLSGNLGHTLKLLVKVPFIEWGELIKYHEVIFLIDSPELFAYDFTEYAVLLLVPVLVVKIFRI